MNKTPTITLFYDGGCPACQYYVAFARVKETVTAIELVNVRELPTRPAVVRDDYDFNEGFALVVGSECYYGAEALHQLTMLSGASPHLNRLNYWLFSSRARSVWLYPLLRLGRRVLLWLLRIPPIINGKG